MNAAPPPDTQGVQAISPRFRALCLEIGHDIDAACAPDGVSSYITVPDLAGFRRLISASDAVRARRASTFFNPAIQARRRLGQGLHDRGEATVFALGDVPEADEEGLAAHLPLHFRAISVAEKTVRAGETWDVSVRGEVWGLDDMEELYVVVNVGRLILEPGASLVVRGNVFVLACDELEVCEPRGDWQIGILPTPHSVDYGDGPMRGSDGRAGAHGADGQSGRAIETENTFLGRFAREGFDPKVLDGQDASPGEPGGAGQRGRNGGACKLAELTFGELVGSLTVFAQAGRGGDGGDGGRGGDGGHGGCAVKGPALHSGTVPDGRAGKGGDGGPGGVGGRAGAGGIASNIYICVPEAAVPRVTRIARPSEPGVPGRGGPGGRGGAGAAGPALNGCAGRDGQSGRNGAKGRSRPAPWIFLNEVPPSGCQD